MASREQGAAFPDGRGALVSWRNLARDGDLSPLRTILSDVFKGTALGDWLETNPPDDDVRSRLLKRVDFVLGAPDDVALRGHLRERLGMLYLAKGHYETTADVALPMLLDRVLDAAALRRSRRVGSR